MLGLINPVTLAAAAVGVLGLAYYKGSQEQGEFYKLLTLNGNLVGKPPATSRYGRSGFSSCRLELLA